MKGNLIAFDTLGGRDAAALIRDGALDDLLIEPPDTRIRPGTIYRAKATRPMKGQGGMMLDSPDGPLFLRQAQGISAGETLIVQTVTHAEAGKATPCSTRVIFKSRYALVTPGAEGRNLSKAIHDEERRVELQELLAPLEVPEGAGLVLRTACETAADDAVLDDLLPLLDLARAFLAEPASGTPEKLVEGPDVRDIVWRDWPDTAAADTEPGSFERHGILDAIEALKGPVPLSGGGAMYVEPTRALVAVDVNSGPDTSQAAGLKANIDALRALPRALRLRGLGGQVVLDLAPFAKKDRRQIEQIAKAALRADPIETSLVGWTPLGHLELQRKRERLPLAEALP